MGCKCKGEDGVNVNPPPVPGHKDSFQPGETKSPEWEVAFQIMRLFSLSFKQVRVQRGKNILLYPLCPSPLQLNTESANRFTIQD